MAVVDVVDVVAVFDGLVAAVGAVMVVVVGVFDAVGVTFALVPVAVVLAVAVTVVEVVDVIVVHHAGVAAVRAVLVVVVDVWAVSEIGGHGLPFGLMVLGGVQSSSAAWTRASSTMWRTCWSRSS